MITPLVKVLGLPSVTFVVPSLQIVWVSALGTTCGVGLTVITTTFDGPAAHPVGLIGTIVYVTVCGHLSGYAVHRLLYDLSVVRFVVL